MTTAVINRSLGRCTVSQTIHSGERRVGKPSLCHIHNGVYELLSRCQHPDGGWCVRSFGLFMLDDVPQWYFDEA